MPYIESHLSLGRHPKLKRLARTLSISYPAAVGHLHYLWWWAFEFAEDGQLTQFSAQEISTEAGWEGDADLFRHALADAGFLDEDGSLHDWPDYTGHFFEQKEANRKRQQAWRDRQKQKDEHEHNALRNGYVTEERNVTVTESNALPYLTVPNLTLPVVADAPATAPAALLDSHEEVTRDKLSSVLDLYESHTGRVASQAEIDRLLVLIREHNEQLVTEAMHDAIDVGNWRSGWRYIERILDRWQTEGRENGRRPTALAPPAKKKEPFIPMLGLHPSPGVL